MIPLQNTRAVIAAVTGLLLVGSTTLVRADIKDYQFQLVDKVVKVGPDSVVTVRLLNTKTGKSVPDAVIFATQLDMAPDGMQEMAIKIVAMPSSEPGVYRFQANVAMAGSWRLSLGAKVQSEEGSVSDALVIKAAE
jgi:hypothetical protein